MIKNQAKLIQYLTLSLMLSCFGVSFDAFWHLTRGRETFFALPHLFIYLGSVLAIYFAFLGHKYAKNIVWTRLFRILLLIPLSAPLDEIWHRVKGKESVDSVLILWSPPHAMLFISAMLAIFTTALLVSKTDRLKNKNLVGSVLLGLFLNLLIIFSGPFYPTSPINIMGSSGIGVIAAGSIITYLFARRLFNDYGAASLTAAVTVMLQMMMFDANFYTPAGKEFFHMPDWNLMLVYFIPAFLIDLTDSWYAPTRGMMVGIALGLTFFLLGGYAPDSPFVYADLWSGTIASALGGIFAGLTFEHFIQNKKTA